MIDAQPIRAQSHAGRSGQFASPGQDRMWAWGFVWDGAGRLVDRLDPQGVRAATAYRPEGWADAITYSYPDLPDETVDYRVYDVLGNPQRIDFPEGITQPRNDARSQVVSGSYGLSGTNETFRYDLDGNRVFHRRAGVDRDLVVDAADQLGEVRRQTDAALLEQFFYDAAGRRTARLDVASGVTTGYAYDGLGRLTAVADTTGYELSLEYDPLGSRIRRTETQPSAGSETTLFLAGLVELRDVDAAGQAAEVVRWIPGPGPGGVVAEVSAGPSAQAPVLWSLLGDAAGNVVRMARVDVVAGGALATTRATVRYAAFGQEIQASGSAPTQRRFAGMLHEGASGLVHMGARHYDPRLGAFLQPDPLGIAAVATYAYAANNPYRFVDPSGLDPASIAGNFFGGSSGSSFVSSLSGGSGFGGGTASASFSAPQFDPNRVPLLDAQRPCGARGCDFSPVNSAAVVAAPLLFAGGSVAFAAVQASNLSVMVPLTAGLGSVMLGNALVRVTADAIVTRNAALGALAAGTFQAINAVRNFASNAFGALGPRGPAVFEFGSDFIPAAVTPGPPSLTPGGVAGFASGQAVGVFKDSIGE